MVRLLDDNSTDSTDTEQYISSQATGALLVSGMITVLAVLAFVLMGNIQTPKTFARRDLVKGKINK
ncbi:MAG: hypothetical protein P4L10_16465 [Acidobacteriaceae bacterium]|nr:hypothetical protein [Acidobacteriaceae bacterium]